MARSKQPQHRAAFPPDSYYPYDNQQPSPGYSGQDPWNPLYPDDAYQIPHAQPQRFGYSPDPFQPDRDPLLGTIYPDDIYPPYPPSPVPRRKKKRNRGWMMAAFGALLLLILLIWLISNAYNAYPAFRQAAAFNQDNRFIDGIIVDGVAIGGMTRAQAEQALLTGGSATSQPLRIMLRIDDTMYTLTENEIPFERNTQAILDKAYAIGRQNTTQTLNTSVTPMEWRRQVRDFTASQKAYLYTQVTYDKTKVRSYVNFLASMVEVQAKDAMLATFDFNTHAFTFTDEIIGRKLDKDALYQALIAQLDSKNYQATVQIATTAVMPQVTRVELMNTFVRISSYTTETTADFNRNTNIQLAASAVNGTVLASGESFSFNAATGQRTLQKGYLEAAAISGGTTTDEVGGGVCQVSSTLFNAAMMADMTLVSRSPHTWPSTYVDSGRDATVNWPNLDFKFKNGRDTPIFIVCYYTSGKTMSSKGKITVEIYGVTLGTGESVELRTKLISTEQPPAEPIYQRNASLAPGEEKVLKKARTGYVYETYRVYLRGGSEYKRTLLCTSTYKMIQQVIEYN